MAGRYVARGGVARGIGSSTVDLGSWPGTGEPNEIW